MTEIICELVDKDPGILEYFVNECEDDAAERVWISEYLLFHFKMNDGAMFAN
jgi:hypothetical protein